MISKLINTNYIIFILYQMTSKSNKYALLDKNQYDESDMIQMVDMNNFQGSGTQNTSSKTDADYVRLDDQNHTQSKPIKKPQQPEQPKRTQQQPQAGQKKPQSQIRPQNSASQNPYIYPTTNPQPTNINMNGSSYRLQNAPQQQKTAKIPQMKVACNFCTFQQSVPGNTQVFVCCCCNNMNQCFPLYGLFICGNCQGKVCYPYGTSQMIRCTRCGTINRVPAQPKKSYIKDLPKKEEPRTEQSVNKVDKKEQIKFTQEQEIIIEDENEPERPLEKRKQVGFEQEIFFEDIPSKKQQKQQQTYPDIL